MIKSFFFITSDLLDGTSDDNSVKSREVDKVINSKVKKPKIMKNTVSYQCSFFFILWLVSGY